MKRGPDSPAADFNLYLITDRKQAPRQDLLLAVEGALEGGVRAVQLREKDLSSRELYDLGRELRRITADYGAKLIINDRVDIALGVDADGVHLGHQSMPIYPARRVLGANKLIGASCHSHAHAVAAQEMGADFITFGPVFFTPSKAPYGEPVGLEKLEQVTQALRIPVFALGGINRDNCCAALDRKAAGISLISAIVAASDPASAARDILATLSAYRNEQ